MTSGWMGARTAALVSGATLAVQLCAAPARAQGLSADDVAQLRRLMDQQAATLRHQQAELARLRARLNLIEAQNRPGAPRVASSEAVGTPTPGPASAPRTVGQGSDADRRPKRPGPHGGVRPAARAISTICVVA